LQSRHHKPLTAYFPEVTAAVDAQVPPGTVLDGELVIYRGGHCDFVALHQRLTGGRGRAVAAASYVVFDVLTVAGRDLRSLPYRRRRKRMRRLYNGRPSRTVLTGREGEAPSRYSPG